MKEAPHLIFHQRVSHAYCVSFRACRPCIRIRLSRSRRGQSLYPVSTRVFSGNLYRASSVFHESHNVFQENSQQKEFGSNFVKKSYLRYYEQLSPFAALHFWMNSLFEKSYNQKYSLMNRQLDYVGLQRNPKRLGFHRELNNTLLEAIEGWPDFDYGEGYFYQSLEEIGVRGLRNTESRIQSLDLLNKVAGKTVLEIGCNTGFISLSLAKAAKRVVAFDVNPFLVSIAKKVSAHLNHQNVEFLTCSFEEFEKSRKFDVVLSLANHSTYDQNTKHSIDSYFRRCKEHLNQSGILVFESHPTEHEQNHGENVFHLLSKYFTLDHTTQATVGNPMDLERMHAVGAPILPAIPAT